MPSPSVSPSGALRAFSYQGLFVASRALGRLSNACAYLAAGMCTRGELAASLRAQFDAFDHEPDYAQSGLTPFEGRLVDRWLPKRGLALVLGCGPGRELVALIRRGYGVVGVEQAPDAAARARANLSALGLAGVVETARLEHVEAAGPFLIVLFSDSCYSNVQGAEQRIASLRRVVSRMEPDARMLLFYQAATTRSRAALGLMRLGARLAGGAWYPEPGDCVTPGPGGALFFTHTFVNGEVATECEAAGLHVLGEETSGRLRCAVACLASAADRPEPRATEAVA